MTFIKDQEAWLAFLQYEHLPETVMSARKFPFYANTIDNDLVMVECLDIADLANMVYRLATFLTRH